MFKKKIKLTTVLLWGLVSYILLVLVLMFAGG
jgi:hypothetical protein